MYPNGGVEVVIEGNLKTSSVYSFKMYTVLQFLELGRAPAI
jgi:hypothetical protein